MKSKILVALAIIAGVGSLQSCKSNNEPEPETNKINGHEYVDLGLSVKWATCNVGATMPTEYGDYYSWAITEPYTHSWFDNTEIEEISGTQYDVAHVNWGGTWRMPTNQEMRELLSKCTWEWLSNGAKSGYNITGPNGNTIFFPAAGIYQGEILVTETQAYYWTSTRYPSDPGDAYGLHFVEDEENSSKYVAGYNIGNGMSIRPVSN